MNSSDFNKNPDSMELFTLRTTPSSCPLYWKAIETVKPKWIVQHQLGGFVSWPPFTGDFKAHQGRSTCVTFSPDSKQLASGGGVYDGGKNGKDSNVYIW
jgi:WD40 repeat protein